MPGLDRLVILGVVAKAHGVRGEVAISADEGVVEDLLGHETLYLRRPGREPEPHRVESARAVARGVLVYFEDVGDRNAAEALRGCEVLVPRSSLRFEGEYLTGDLIGLKAIGTQGQALGKVEALEQIGDVPTLIVRGVVELQVPLVDLFVKHIDLEAGEIVIEPPEEE